MDIPFVFTIVCTTGGAVWFLSKELDKINTGVEKIRDDLRDYQLINNNTVNRQKERITSLKLHAQEAFNDLNRRVTDIENVLIKNPSMQYHKRHTSAKVDIETSGDFDSENWTEIK